MKQIFIKYGSSFFGEKTFIKQADEEVKNC
jgi:hypothetical protein